MQRVSPLGAGICGAEKGRYCILFWPIIEMRQCGVEADGWAGRRKSDEKGCLYYKINNLPCIERVQESIIEPVFDRLNPKRHDLILVHDVQTWFRSGQRR